MIISSYLPEAMGLADRMYVMADGEIKDEFSRSQLAQMSEQDILEIASQID